MTTPNTHALESCPPPSAETLERLLVGLNSAQREAVTHKDGPLLVLAGPGSGKTRVVTHRVAWLLANGVRGSQIAALTFTNKAADEMKTRLATLAPGNRVWIGTFHRFCAFLLRYYASYAGLDPNYAIYDAEQSKKLLESLIEKNDLPNGVDLPKIASAISWAKNTLVSSEAYDAKEGSLLGKVVEKAYPAYQEALRKANAVDFDDLLFHIATLLKEHEEIRANLDYRFRYILVDEYQDTNLVQYAIARALSVDYPNLAATGDPDQSIYGWRGANIQNILNFEQDFENAKVVRLEQNYRSDKSILRLADSLIKHNVYRKDKNLYTENKEGVPPRIIQCLDQSEEAEIIAAEIASEIASGKRRPRDYAIFYRMNALSRNLEYSLKRYNVPFQLVRGLEFFNRKEIKDLCSYLQLVHNPNDIVSFKRVINLPTRGIGRVSLSRLESYANARGLSLFEASQNAKEILGLSSRVQKSLGKFVELIDQLRETVASGSDLEVALSILLEKTQYLEYLRTSSKTEEDEQRLANIQELLSEVREFDSDFEQLQAESKNTSPFPEFTVCTNKLGMFLEQVALVSDVDAWNSNDDRVSLMTLHAAKGLEFPVVYIVALEENVLPHERSTHDKRQLEEERRLLFVGLTRAEEEIRISHTRFREFRGSFSASISSRFQFEFPHDGIDTYKTVDEWLESIKRQQEDDPESTVVLPKIFERKSGLSQHHIFWEEGVDPENPDEGFSRIDDFSSRFSGRGSSFDRRNAIKSRKASSEDGFEIQETEDDYSQAQSEEYDGIDEPSDESVFFESCDASSTPPRSHSRVKKTASKKKRRELSLNAISTGDVFDKLTNEHKSKTSIPPQTIQVNSFVRHRQYGVGVVKKITETPPGRTFTVSFLSGTGQVEVPSSDPDLNLVAIGRGEEK